MPKPSTHLATLTVVLAATISTGAACHRSRPSGRVTAPATTVDTGTVMLEVENHNWSDVDLYVLHDGRTNRLGMVTAAKDALIPVPVAFQGEIGVFQLVARRIGGTDSYTSEPISVRTGNTVRFTIESKLTRSSVGVW